MPDPESPSMAERGSWLARLLAPAVWLSGQLSFSRKYLLIGVLVLFAMVTLSMPLWLDIRQNVRVAGQERQGLEAFTQQVEALVSLVALRDRAMREARGPDGLVDAQQALDALGAQEVMTPESRQLLQMHWDNVLLAVQEHNPQQRFASITGTINGVLALIQSSARAHRLNVDAELDAAFEMLTLRLPLVFDTLGKQRDALGLPAGDMASYALGAQVVLTESMPGLKAGVAQLRALHGQAGALDAILEQLLEGIASQQDVADKTLDQPEALDELRVLAEANLAQALTLLEAAGEVADHRLVLRIEHLKRTQWVIAALLAGTLALMSYLFVGIYYSTLRSLRSLSDGTNAFCAGRLDTRIRIDTRDELVLVANNFNSVAEEFGHLLEVIRRQNESREQELETQVRARTSELAEKNEQLRAAGERVQEELTLARNMQMAILPQVFPNEAGWAVHACMFPARELGGDFYDGFRLPDGRYGLLVADVSGKGVGAAFFMAVARTVLLDLAMTGQPPAQVLAQANQLLCERNPMELFVTACYGIYSPEKGQLVYASAGHHAPLLRRADGQVTSLPCVQDLALAVLPDIAYADRHCTLQPGDSLLLYTDGITEAFSRTGEAYGEPRLKRWLSAVDPSADAGANPARRLVASLVADVERFVVGAEASDDLTCLILCRKQGAPLMEHPPIKDQNKHLLLDYQLPCRLEEIARLAAAVEAALPERSDLAFSANLCLEELITNIVLHGLKGEDGHIINVRMSISDEWLEIVLKDDAPQFDPFFQVSEPDLDLDVEDRPVGGLGVHLVKTLMDDARAYYDGSGNLIVLLKTLSKTD